tara:strand:- start:269 stop:1018 length:750 start_codon:yes stop_codon:yes gene_type:complete
MKDVKGWRRKFGVIGPSTNTIVQPDFDDMRIKGVTNHYSRIFTPNSSAISNETFLSGTTKISEGVIDAVKSVMTCNPDYLVMGMSAITFYDGIKGAEMFKKKVEDASGIKVSIGSHSVSSALDAYGGIKKIAFLSPYYPVANQEVKRYFEESGFSVVRDICLECKSWTAIAEVEESFLNELIVKELNSEDVDAIIQVGTNLSMVKLAVELECKLNKPVIAINTATYWHALRENNITDKIEGFGKLLSDY